MASGKPHSLSPAEPKASKPVALALAAAAVAEAAGLAQLTT